MQPRKTFFDPAEGYFIRLADLVDFSDENREDTALINESLKAISERGGGTLYLSGGVFRTHTVMLQSNVTIYIDKTATLEALPGEYQYENLIDPATGELYPWALRQDAGHTWYLNSMFYGDGLENVKIIGNGKIDGADNISKYDSLIQNTVFEAFSSKKFPTNEEIHAANTSMPSPDSKGRTCNKTFAIKRCRNLEIGGICPSKDLWYDGKFEGKRGKVGYLNDDGSFDFDSVDNMLHMTDTGHFALLASGCDEVHLHDIYFDNAFNMRDTFNMMSCNDVVVCNIYIEGTTDDVIKFASDMSLGEARHTGNAIVRNIVGDTGCNLLLVGGETDGDIQNICYDNVICLAANKAAIGVSTGGGARLSNIHFNCGGSVGKCCCGTDHGQLSIGYTPAMVFPYRSRATHMRQPINITAGGAPALGRSRIENVYIGKLTCENVFAGSMSKEGGVQVFAEYGHQAETTAMIQGCLPSDDPRVIADPGFGRVNNVVLEDVDILVKGGHSEEERLNVIDPSEGAIGMRAADKPGGGSRLPAYGFYIRRADGVHFKNCTIATEKYDGRAAFHTDDCTDVTFENGSILNPVPKK